MKDYTDEEKIKIIKEYFYLETDESAKELLETNGERFTNEVIEELDRNNFKMESLRRDPRRNRGCRK